MDYMVPGLLHQKCMLIHTLCFAAQEAYHIPHRKRSVLYWLTNSAPLVGSTVREDSARRR